MSMADIDAIRLWCRERVPQHSWASERVEPLVTGRHIDLLHVAATADGETRTLFARLRFLPPVWVLYWRDAEGSFQVYRPLPSSQDVGVLLDFLARGDEPLFWPVG